MQLRSLLSLSTRLSQEIGFRGTYFVSLQRPIASSQYIAHRSFTQNDGGLLNPKSIAKIEEDVRNLLRNVRDPLSDSSVVELNQVNDLYVNPVTGLVSFTLLLPNLAHPHKDVMIGDCRKELSKCSLVKNVEISVKARKPVYSGSKKVNESLTNVEHIIAVSSCKGGVGKSTVAVNLALAMAKQGARVGLLDADIYGPSLPAIIHPPDVTLRIAKDRPGKFIVPIDYEGVRWLSFGYVSSNAGIPGAGGKDAAVMRGPMVTKVINQLLLHTAWDELDHLVIDMPPGTGDIHIALSQAASMTGAVIVTTPQHLSYVDVAKGINMFHSLGVPTLAIVENMSHFVCDHGVEHRPFGAGHLDRIEAEFDVSDSFRLPLSAKIAEGNESRRPVVLSEPSSNESLVYASLARLVTAKSIEAGYGRTATRFSLSFDESTQVLRLKRFGPNFAELFEVSARELRTHDIRSGRSRQTAESIDGSVRPMKIEEKGNYGFRVVWSDGFSGEIYTYEDVTRFAQSRGRVEPGDESK